MYLELALKIFVGEQKNEEELLLGMTYLMVCIPYTDHPPRKKNPGTRSMGKIVRTPIGLRAQFLGNKNPDTQMCSWR